MVTSLVDATVGREVGPLSSEWLLCGTFVGSHVPPLLLDYIERSDAGLFTGQQRALPCSPDVTFPPAGIRHNCHPKATLSPGQGRGVPELAVACAV